MNTLLTTPTGICDDLVKYKLLDKKYSLVPETLRLMLGLKHNMVEKNGVSYPKHHKGFPKDNWVKREKELQGFSKSLYALNVDLERNISKTGRINLDNLLLAQALRSKSFKENQPVIDDNTSEESMDFFLHKYRADGVSILRDGIDKKLPGHMLPYNSLNKLAGFTPTDMAFRLVVYTSDDIGLASTEPEIRGATVGLFEQLTEEAWNKILEAKERKSISDETILAINTLALISRTLQSPGLGINDQNILIKDYSIMIHSIANELLDKAITICKELVETQNQTKVVRKENKRLAHV